VRVWHVGTSAGLFATLLLTLVQAAAYSGGEPVTPQAGAYKATSNTSAAPIWIVRMNDNDPMYQPSIVRINAGETVEWENDGQVSHSVTDDPARANNPADALLPAGVQPFNSGSVMPGGRFRHTFSEPGRYRYFCLSHEEDRMVGEVIVNATPSASALQRVARSIPPMQMASAPHVSSAAPIQIVKMSDDEPMYRPNLVKITAGQTVEWENDGQVSHSATDDPARANNPADALLPAGAKPFNSGNVMPGGRFRYTFTRPGRYRYFCLTHEGDRMVGEVIVESPEREQFAESNSRDIRYKSGSPAPSKTVIGVYDDKPIYRPDSIQIMSGETVLWKNEGHTVHSVSDDPARALDPIDALHPAGVKPFSSGNIPPGGQFSHTFTKPGRYRYFCPINKIADAVGEVVVRPNDKEEASRRVTGRYRLSAMSGEAVTE
jgi:plastocyanin